MLYSEPPDLSDTCKIDLGLTLPDLSDPLGRGV